MKYFYKTSIKYKVITFIFGVLFWITFNFLTGLITSNKSLVDNHFVLLISLSYAAFLCSYKIKFDRGHIFTYQFGMVTNSIDLYKSDKVLAEGNRLVIYYPDDSRFPIKISRFDDVAINKIQESVQPHLGQREIDNYIEQDISVEKKSQKFKPSSSWNIFGGAILLGLAITALFTDVIYVPGRGGFIRLNESPNYFYFFLGLLFIFGSASLINGILRKFRATEA